MLNNNIEKLMRILGCMLFRGLEKEINHSEHTVQHGHVSLRLVVHFRLIFTYIV